MSLTCLAIASCNANAEIKVQKNLNVFQPVEKINNKNSVKLASVEEQGINSSNTTQYRRFGEKNKLQKISTGPALQRNGNYMTLTPTEQANSLGNPLYELKLFANGQLVTSYMTVSGRKDTQHNDRNKSGTEAPLPDGLYNVATVAIRGSTFEAGDRFLPIQPLFATSRSSLGIHYDPSFNKNNGEDGTSGCIALTNREDLSQVLEYVSTYKPEFLDVAIR